MLNTIQPCDNENVSTIETSKYEKMPANWIAQDLYSTLLEVSSNNDFLEKFDSIPQDKLNNTLKNYGKKNEYGLLSAMYIILGIGIRELKPRILRIINLVSFKDKEKRKIWELYGNFNDFDDFIEEHNAGIIKEIDSLLLNIF